MIWTHLSNYRDTGLLLLRGVAGLYMAFGHGLSKITSGPEQWAELGGAMGLLGIDVLPVFWGFMSAFAEFVCALLVSAGLLTRLAAAFLVANMTVAANVHIQTGDGSPESALIYAPSSWPSSSWVPEPTVSTGFSMANRAVPIPPHPPFLLTIETR